MDFTIQLYLTASLSRIYLRPARSVETTEREILRMLHIKDIDEAYR